MRAREAQELLHGDIWEERLYRALRKMGVVAEGRVKLGSEWGRGVGLNLQSNLARPRSPDPGQRRGRQPQVARNPLRAISSTEAWERTE